MPRVGGAVGAGVEVALASHWTAQLQYLFTDYGNTSVTFPAGAQRFTSDLTLHELTFGLNYRFNSDTSTSADKDVTPPALQTDNFAVHGQTTFLRAIRSGVSLALYRAEQPDPEPGTRDLGRHRSFSGCGCGTAPSFGSIRKSTRASA